MLAERCINVCHTMIQRWVKKYDPLLYQMWKQRNKSACSHWKIDEAYIKIKGK